MKNQGVGEKVQPPTRIKKKEAARWWFSSVVWHSVLEPKKILLELRKL